MNHKQEALWLSKKCKLYILYILIFANPFHLTIEWKLFLIQKSEFEFQNVVM